MQFNWLLNQISHEAQMKSQQDCVFEMLWKCCPAGLLKKISFEKGNIQDGTETGRYKRQFGVFKQIFTPTQLYLSKTEQNCVKLSNNCQRVRET